jgi:serine/threonine-protein kinase
MGSQARRAEQLQWGALSSNLDTEADARVGAVLNQKWTLERLLGVGGMAAVYAGRHRNGARAAVKVLHRELSGYKEVRERFQREGYAANKVQHPNVVKVMDDDVVSDGPDEGTAYLVMELLEGESLLDRLERGQDVGEREFLEMALEILSVLQAAEAAGVVHRDLKPENIFFAHDPADPRKPNVKVLDFGLARILTGQAITTYGLALGTPSFMSPEQAAGRLDEIDIRTDLFALAATGFRIRTGRRIHDGADAVELVTKMSRLPAPRIRTVDPGVSAPFARVVDRALEFRREDRYGSAAAMADDVRRAIAELDAGAGNRPPSARPPPPPPPRRPTKPPPREAPAEPTVELSERDFVRRPAYGLSDSIRIPKNASVLPWMVLLLVGAGGYALWRQPSHGMDLVESAERWGRSLIAQWQSSDPGQSPTPPPEPSATIAPEAGAVGSASQVAHQLPLPDPSATAHHPHPARLGPGNVRNLQRPH